MDKLAVGRADDKGRFAGGVDASVAHQARVYDYWLGGKANAAVDREAAELALAAYPGLRHGVLAQRAVSPAWCGTWQARPASASSSTSGQAARPRATPTKSPRWWRPARGDSGPGGGDARQPQHDAHIVYVDNDPMVLAHAQALLATAAEGASTYVDCDLRDTGTLISEHGAQLGRRHHPVRQPAGQPAGVDGQRPPPGRQARNAASAASSGPGPPPPAQSAARAG